MNVLRVNTVQCIYLSDFIKDVYDINLTASTTKVVGSNSVRLELEDYMLFGQVALENMNFDRFHIWWELYIVGNKILLQVK